MCPLSRWLSTVLAQVVERSRGLRVGARPSDSGTGPVAVGRERAVAWGTSWNENRTLTQADDTSHLKSSKRFGRRPGVWEHIPPCAWMRGVGPSSARITGIRGAGTAGK